MEKYFLIKFIGGNRMRTVTEVFKVYNYNELSETAKEKVKEWYLNDDFRTYDFSDMCNEDLNNLFESNLKVQYSLGYCQGDGLNIYGEVYAEDIFKCLEEHRAGTQLEEFESVLTEKEKKTILCYSNECGGIKLEYNNRYCYSLADYIDIVEEWKFQLESYSCFKNINTEVLQKFESLVRGIFEKLCTDYEKNGYEYFYEIDDDEILEVCDCNGWEFYENGEFYAA